MHVTASCCLPHSSNRYMMPSERLGLDLRDAFPQLAYEIYTLWQEQQILQASSCKVPSWALHWEQLLCYLPEVICWTDRAMRWPTCCPLAFDFNQLLCRRCLAEMSSLSLLHTNDVCPEHSRFDQLWWDHFELGRSCIHSSQETLLSSFEHWMWKLVNRCLISYHWLRRYIALILEFQLLIETSYGVTSGSIPHSLLLKDTSQLL